ncbi:DNA-directed RNA polymerase II subunit RPB4 [Pancytospora philotis]|nr:DNA-directed RNA polymerase II subunit RPB4 [Pancytospora philotis]
MSLGDEKASHPITTSEAYHLLHPLKSRYKNTRSPAYKIYKETLDYVEALCKIKEKSIVDDLRLTLFNMGLSEDEVVSFGTLFPQTLDEAKILVPSIVRLDDATIDLAISKVQRSVY